MNSTPSSKIILEANNLDFFYNLDYFKSESFRGQFIELFQNPLDFFTDNSVPHWVIKDASFKIHKGDRVGIIGTNGAGKTTLCRCLAGMLVPNSGSLSLSGSCRPIFNTGVGVLPELTGRENAELLTTFIYPYLNKREVNDLVTESLIFSELKEFVDVPYRNYSKGMQTRLFLSVVSARPSDLLIFDEVFDGADEFFQKKIGKRFLDLMDQSGAIVFVSHTPDQIRDICNRVMVLHEHKIYFDGNVEQGIELYQNLNLQSPNQQ
jgi:ABC-type polysaccharide/polyol phosphate transport system ATPase subunit